MPTSVLTLFQFLVPNVALVLTAVGLVFNVARELYAVVDGNVAGVPQTLPVFAGPVANHVRRRIRRLALQCQFVVCVCVGTGFFLACWAVVQRTWLPHLIEAPISAFIPTIGLFSAIVVVRASMVAAAIIQLKHVSCTIPSADLKEDESGAGHAATATFESTEPEVYNLDKDVMFFEAQLGSATVVETRRHETGADTSILHGPDGFGWTSQYGAVVAFRACSLSSVIAAKVDIESWLERNGHSCSAACGPWEQSGGATS